MHMQLCVPPILAFIVQNYSTLSHADPNRCLIPLALFPSQIGGTSQTATLALSPQQLVSCCTSATGCASQGCNGGWSDDVSGLAGVAIIFFL